MCVFNEERQRKVEENSVMTQIPTWVSATIVLPLREDN